MDTESGQGSVEREGKKLREGSAAKIARIKNYTGAVFGAWGLSSCHSPYIYAFFPLPFACFSLFLSIKCQIHYLALNIFNLA